MSFDIAAFDATALAGLVASKEVSAGELLDAACAMAEAWNPLLNAVVLHQETVARRMIAEGLPKGPFRGVPFLLKDLGAEARDFPTTNGSALFNEFRWSYDSEIYRRMKATGIVPFARTTSPEGGIGPVTEAAVYGGPTRNPWDLSRTPGGSSGGSGAAVAAGIVPMAHGSDGGGSVRIPASSCGLFGFKATRGRFPDGPMSGEGWGGMAIDGFLSRTVRDSAAMMDACAGADAGAPYVAPTMPMTFAQAITWPPQPLRVGLCTTTFTGGAIAPECQAGVEATGLLLESLGHHMTPFMPQADHAGMMHAWTRIVACGTALTIRERLKALGRDLQDGDVEGVARGAIAYARTISGADYLSAIETVHSYGRAMATVFDDIDVLVSATLAEPPAEIGRFHHDREDFLEYRTGPGGVFNYSPFCASFNASGQPAMSVPLHWTDEGLPIGIHIAAPFGADARLMSLASQLEQAAPWTSRWPTRPQ